jgi:hypothetical protein
VASPLTLPSFVFLPESGPVVPPPSCVVSEMTPDALLEHPAPPATPIAAQKKTYACQHLRRISLIATPS